MDTMTGMLNNVILLVALSVIHEIVYSFSPKLRKFSPFISGVLIGLIGIAIMTLPFQLQPGVFFDTRTILIGVAALMFGGIPAGIAAAATAAYRIALGGDGVYMGVATILVALLVGLVWNRFVLKKGSRFKWLNIYAFGLTIHALMLLCTFLLPAVSRAEILNAIALPIMLIYPVGTVLLSLLLLVQKNRSQAVADILEVENRYKNLFDDNYAVMLLIDPETGNLLEANRAAAAFYGWPAGELTQMNIAEINTALPLDQIKASLEKALLQTQNRFISRHRKKSGRIVDVEVYSGPIDFKGKKMVYSIVHDISDRLKAQQSLQESEALFRTLVEGSPDTIFIQTDQKFSFINHAGLSLFGAASADELIGRPVMERFHPDYHAVIADRIHQLNIEKKPLPPNETVFLKMDGTPVWVDVQAVPVTYKDSDGAIVFVRDITEKKNRESADREMEAQMRQQQKLEAIGTLAGGVAHEINNPINGIMNYAQLILDSIGQDAKDAEYAREIIHETERVSAIVKNLLQFSRIEKQSHSYASIQDIISQTVSLIRTVIKKDQIDFQISLEENLPDIKCRSQQIQQVLMNLLTNARDALNEKYPGYSQEKIIRLSCTQFQEAERRWIRITVEDHGNGIPRNVIEKIYEPFFSTKAKDKGTGLGLSISFGIVKDHHGRLTVQTKEGKYTRFNLELPVDNGWELKTSGE